MRIVTWIAVGAVICSAQTASAQGLPLPQPIPPHVGTLFGPQSLSFTYWPEGSSRPKTLRIDLRSGEAQVISGGGGGITASPEVILPPGALLRVRQQATRVMNSKPRIVPLESTLDAADTSPGWVLNLVARDRKVVFREGSRADADRLGDLLLNVAAKVENTKAKELPKRKLPHPPICWPHPPIHKLPWPPIARLPLPPIARLPLPMFPILPGGPALLPYYAARKALEFAQAFQRWHQPQLHFPNRWQRALAAASGVGRRLGEAVATGAARVVEQAGKASAEAGQGKEAPKTVNSRGILGGLER